MLDSLPVHGVYIKSRLKPLLKHRSWFPCLQALPSWWQDLKQGHGAAGLIHNGCLIRIPTLLSNWELVQGRWEVGIQVAPGALWPLDYTSRSVGLGWR